MSFNKFVNLNYCTRKFATATRNYAKRQLQWYRKDKNFLWLENQRHNSTSLHPYEDIANEIKHWCNIARQDYESIIELQLQRAEVVTKVREKKRPYKFSDTEYTFSSIEKEVLLALVESNEISIHDVLRTPINATLAGEQSTLSADGKHI